MTLRQLLSYGGLVLFLIVHVLTLLALLVDGNLLRTGTPTISEQTWREPVLALGPLAWQLVGVLGLGVHLLISPD